VSLPSNLFGKVARLLGTPGALAAAFSWKPFSITAYKLVRNLKAFGLIPELVIDVGANEGQFSRAVRESYGGDVAILGFEPLDAAYSRLQSNFSGDSMAVFRRCAIGAENGTSEINLNTFSQSSSFMRLGENHLSAFPNAREIGRRAVEMVRLDDALKDVKWRSPSLLKIDVQGYESKVLEGASSTLDQVDHVLVEIGLIPLYTDEPTYSEINDQLQRAGLEFVASVATLWDDKKGIAIQMDALFRRRS